MNEFTEDDWMLETFDRFLRDKSARDAYCEYTRYDRVMDVRDENPDDDYDYLISAFDWGKTKEGSKYWRDIAFEWNELSHRYKDEWFVLIHFFRHFIRTSGNIINGHDYHLQDIIRNESFYDKSLDGACFNMVISAYVDRYEYNFIVRDCSVCKDGNEWDKFASELCDLFADDLKYYYEY